MEKEQLIEVIDKLVGGITPIGDTNYDNKSNNNLTVMIDIVGHYIDEICKIAQTDSYMASIQNSQSIAKDFIKGLKDAYDVCHNGWISCSEMLPVSDTKVLVWYQGEAWDDGTVFYDYALTIFWTNSDLKRHENPCEFYNTNLEFKVVLIDATLFAEHQNEDLSNYETVKKRNRNENLKIF